MRNRTSLMGETEDRATNLVLSSTGVLMCLFLLLLSTGCGESARTSSPEAKETVVGIVSPALTSIFHVSFVEGAQMEGKNLGWSVESLAADRETNFAAQVNLVQALVRRKVDAISICAINDKAIVGAVEEANAAGVPIFIHNSLTELPGGEVQAYIGYNQRKAGRLCGEYACDLLQKKHGGYKGAIYILEGIPGFHSRERTRGFMEALAEHPDIEVVGKNPANWERQQGMNLASAALKAHPEIDLFFGCSDAMAQGAAQAAIEANREVFTIGIDGNPDTLEDVRNGVVTATCSVFPDEMGAIAIRTISAHLGGEAVDLLNETPIRMIDKSNVSELLPAEGS